MRSCGVPLLKVLEYSVGHNYEVKFSNTHFKKFLNLEDKICVLKIVILSMFHFVFKVSK
jgi:hypothetical protein